MAGGNRHCGAGNRHGRGRVDQLPGIALGKQLRRHRRVQGMPATVHHRVRDDGMADKREVADQIEAWFTTPACDGFVVAPTHQPGCFEAFVQYVVPELQKRGLYRKDYTGVTLREHLGLPRPELGAWRTKLDAEG